MPVNAMPAKWAEGPCLFRFPCVSTAVCTRCKDSFTFLNGRRHCEFCGYVFHRVHCTRKIKLDGEFFRRRICTHCDFYRNIAGASLRDGGEFTCYRKGRPTPVKISLSEERGELDFVWLSHGVHESLRLEYVEVQKGFSHAGHMRAADYDPLKSLSLLVRTGKLVTTVDLRSSSAWMCQLWVDGLTAAKYVHQRVLEQASALQLYSSAGERLYDRDSWFGTNYLPTANRVVVRRRRRTTGDSRQRSTLHFSFSSRACGRRQVADRCMSESPSEGDDEDFVEIELPRDLSGQPSHAASPSPMQQDSPPHKHATSPVHIPAQLDVSSLPVERTLIHSTPGLPYLQTPLSSICGCHAFEIAPSRSFNFGEGDVAARQRETGSKCCTRCRLTCRIVVDLSNI